MKLKNVLPVVVLVAICLVSALLLSLINTVTSPIIEAARNQAANENLLVVLPDVVTPNYFLFDAESNRNLPVEALSEDLVFERVDLFVSRLVRKRSELWLPGKLNACKFGEEGQFAPLVAYKMLIDLGEADSDGAWRCFCAAAPETVKWIADTLQPLEPNMTKDLLAVKMRFSNDPAKVRGFVMHNLKYLRTRAVQYTVKSLDSFDNVSVQ